MSHVVVSGAFDAVDVRLFRFLQEAAALGPVEALLWSDELVHALTGACPAFGVAERRYVLEALRYTDGVTVVDCLPNADALPPGMAADLTWAVAQADDSAAKRRLCGDRGWRYHVVRDSELSGFPDGANDPPDPAAKTVVVTGCYDWFHSGHVRFFEEVSAFGNLHVVVGHDDNVRALKGDGHPMFDERVRRYMVGSIRYVTRAHISTGSGWMDAEPEIDRIHPAIYAVNEDGDRPEKRRFCETRGIEYLVLKREPKPGLTRRSSTDLRGF